MNASKSVEVNETCPLTTKGASAWAACPGRADIDTATTAASSAKLFLIAITFSNLFLNQFHQKRSGQPGPVAEASGQEYTPFSSVMRMFA